MTNVYSSARNHALTAFRVLGELSSGDCEANPKLSDAMHQLIAMRNELIDARRAGEPCVDALRASNAIISSIFGVEFPSAGLQWQRVCDTRQALQNLIDSLEKRQADSNKRKG